MTIDDFLQHFDSVKHTKKGWDVRCPAHDDTRPSLGIMAGEDGRIVLNCFAGCRPEDIVTALGLTMSDLFADDKVIGRITPVPQRVRPVDRKQIAWAFELRALDFELKANEILDKAKDCEDCDAWTDADRELAMQAIARAYRLQDQAQRLREEADHLREQAYESA
jgi:hypothetical protein